MDANILCTLLSERIAPDKFQLHGTDIHWIGEPTLEELAIVGDVTANYETLASAMVVAQMRKQAIDAIQSVLDEKAREHGFDNIHTAGVWTLSKNVNRKARADALITWSDSVWDFAEAEWALQAAGTPTYTTIEEFIAALPVFTI